MKKRKENKKRINIIAKVLVCMTVFAISVVSTTILCFAYRMLSCEPIYETTVIHHDAVTHEEPVYEIIEHPAITEKVWVVDQPAYDETVTYYECTECGEKR